MPRSALTGTRIRERRTVLEIKQADLARSVGISPSYLNLIEHNRRKIGGKLLVQIARALSVDMAALTQGAEAELLDQINEAALAQKETEPELDRIDEFVGRFPGWAALVVAQQRRTAALEQRVAALADRLSHDPFLSASLHDLLSKVSSIRSTAAILTDTDDLDDVWRDRFHRNLAGDSMKLSEGAAGLIDYLDSEGEVDLVTMTAQEEMEAFLEARNFHIPFLERALPAAPSSIVAAATELRSDAGRARAIVWLEKYRKDAEQMPLAAFGKAAREESYDPARLSLRFGVEMPTVFRRLATLPPVEGAGRIGLAVCDAAGALTLRKPTDGFPLPRFGAACALWPLFQALTRPMTPIRAPVAHAASPGQPFLTYAISQPSHPDGFDGPQVHQAMMLILPAAMLSGGVGGDAIPRVGSSCRVCSLGDCPARREASLVSEAEDGA